MAHIQRTPDYEEAKGENWWLKEYYDVTRPVGPRMPNERSDVALVQLLLNLCHYEARIAVDGICGPKTDGAILKFQREFSPMLRAHGMRPLKCDGVVSRAELLGFRDNRAPATPTMYTIVALNYIAGSKNTSKWRLLPFSEEAPEYLRYTLVGLGG